MDDAHPMSNAPLYMAETMMVEFMRGDRTGLADPNDRTSSQLIVDGPYSSPVKAEQALNERISSWRADCVRVLGMLEADSLGMGEEHSGEASWMRHLVWSDPTGHFADADGWQRVRLVKIDRMPA
jgi:hypothetical protein